MTFEQLLARAHEVLTWGKGLPTAEALARAIIDLLGEEPPCGLEPPSVYEGDDGRFLNIEALVATRDEARAYAAMILREADKLPP